MEMTAKAIIETRRVLAAMPPASEVVTPEPGEAVKDALGEVVGTLKDALWEVVDTPEGPKIAPGPYSGLSISNVGEIVTEGERKDRRHDARHQLEALRWRPSYSLPGVRCEYVVIEETIKKKKL